MELGYSYAVCINIPVINSLRSAVIFAANNNHVELLKKLLELGADINDRSNNLRTPLIWASHWGHDDVVSVLLAHSSIDIDAQDADGMTALMTAARQGHAAILAALLSRGANSSLRNRYSCTALTIAITAGRDEVTTLLRQLRSAETEETDVWPVRVLWDSLLAAVF